MSGPLNSTGIVAMRPFVPAKDLATSLKFYARLGFSAAQLSESIALLTTGNLGFLLQQFDADEFARNYMMQLVVDRLDSWWESLQELDLSKEFFVQPPSAPQMQPWGLRIAYVFDPSGVLWHVTELPVSGHDNAPGV